MSCKQKTVLLNSGQPHNFAMLFAMVSGNTDSLNCADKNGTRDHGWLTALLGNAPQVWNNMSK